MLRPLFEALRRVNPFEKKLPMINQIEALFASKKDVLGRYCCGIVYENKATSHWDVVFYLCVKKGIRNMVMRVRSRMFNASPDGQPCDHNDELCVLLKETCGFDGQCPPFDEGLLQEAFGEICRKGDKDILRHLALDSGFFIIFNEWPGRYLKFLEVYADICSFDVIRTHFRDIWALHIFLFAALAASGRIGMLSQLSRKEPEQTLQYVDDMINYGQSNAESIAWITCRYANAIRCKIAKWGVYFLEPTEQGSEHLLVFGIWPAGGNGHLAQTLRASSRRRLVTKLSGKDKVEKLLEDIEGKDTEGPIIDIIYMCIFMNRMDVLKAVLKEHQLDLASFPFALHWAIRSRKLAMTKFVGQRCRWQINSPCELGFTPLVLAVFTGKRKLVKYLFTFPNLNVSVTSINKLTAYNCAQGSGDPKLQQLFKRSARCGE